jgi:hypothetical protein
MVTDFRKMVNRVSIPAGRERGALVSKIFRHTYCPPRLQTLDRAAPVSSDAVGREMGHSSRDPVEQVDGHLGGTRHRAEAVGYRIELYQERLQDRLALLNQ